MEKDLIIQAQGQAFRLLRKYGQLEASPVELEVIACGEGLDFELGHLSGCEARLVRDASGTGIARISDRIKEPGRVRFALAHELGHFMMHVGQSQTKACTRGDLSDYRKKPLEAQANIFGSEILMPTAHFRALAAKTGPTFDQIGKLAERFNVSLTAAIIRFIDLGAIDEMTLVCIGPDRRVKWSKSRYENWSLWIEQGMQIPPSSMAECAFLAKDSVDATDLHPSVWFNRVHGRTMTEECHFMSDYGATLSLLVLEPD